MNTKWTMAVFMFLAFLAAVLLLYGTFKRCAHGKRPVSILIACACAMGAIGVIVMGLNNPAKILTILGTPTKGYSGAVIMQAVVMIAAIITFLQASSKPMAVKIIVVAVSCVSIFALSRIYMISTRPALNTYLIALMLTALLFQSAGLLSRNSRGRLLTMVITSVYGVCVLAFFIRLMTLAPQDRILDFTRITTGSLAPIFWGMVLLTAAVPFLYGLYALMKGKTGLSGVIALLNLAGVFLLFMLICQMPVVERGINNRIFF